MAVRVDEQWLQRWCGKPLDRLSAAGAYEIATHFGSLAAWWLNPDVLKLAACYVASNFPGPLAKAADQWRTPRLPQGCGDCWVILVNERPDRLPLLRPGRVLPLHWAKAAEHDARLPAGLLQVAEQVLDQLRGEDVKGIWRLRVPTEDFLQSHDLSALDGSYGSVWAPLAAGLLLAASQGKPDPAVWSSGAWLAGKGTQPIDELEAKLAVAAEFGAESFFLPETDVRKSAVYRNVQTHPTQDPPDRRRQTAAQRSFARLPRTSAPAAGPQ